jgi:hypothetical protein
MKKRKDPLSGELSEYDTFVNNLYDQVNANLIPWNIPAAVAAAILALLTIWNAKWAVSKVKATATSGDRTATQTARKNLTAYLRPFVQTLIMRNANMSDEDIIDCGLEPYDRTRTKIGRPDTVPNMEYRNGGIHIIDAFFRQGAKQPGVNNRGKPLNVAFCKVAYFIGDEPPANPATFPHVLTSSRSPFHIVFDAEDARKKVWFAACWLSESNLDGDWTEVQMLNIA